MLNYPKTPLFVIAREKECDGCSETISLLGQVFYGDNPNPVWEPYVDICTGCEDWAPSDVPSKEEQIDIFLETLKCWLEEILDDQPLKEYNGPWKNE